MSALLAASHKGALAQATDAKAAEAVVLPAGAVRLVPLEVSVNGAGQGNWMLMEHAGELYAPSDAFEEWRIAPPAGTQTVAYQNRTWIRLAAIPGFAAQWNPANQSVELRFNPAEFAQTHLKLAMSETLTLSPALTAAFVNYDISQSASSGPGAPRSSELGALVELGVTSGLGVVTGSFVGRDLAGSGSGATWRRLETTFTRDFPDSNVTLRLGDAATRGGLAGRINYFGGVQLARNFALSPGLLTQGVPVIAGQSAAPSTVELYVNEALRQTAQVPAGPFTFENFPLLTGSGQARMVVRDLLGRETVIEQSFFSHSDLLREGLSDWSVEAGALRNNLGLENADYGPRFASGLLRYGLNRRLTLEGRAVASARTQGATAGVTLQLPGEMLGQFAAAASAGDAETGRLRGRQWLAGIERWGVHHGFSLRGEFASRDFRQLGVASEFAYRSQISASYSYAGGKRGSLALAFARSERFDEAALNTVTANYTLPLNARSSLTFNASRVSGALSANSVSVYLTLPLGDHGSYQGNVSSRDGRGEAYLSASQPLTQDNGWGWRALARTSSDTPGGEAGVYYQGGKGLVTADVSRTDDFNYLRLSAQGGLVFAGGGVFAARKVQESFALVEVPGYADVGVGFQGSIQARTNADGQALLTRLMPFRRNGIQLDPNELPISAELDSIEQTVVPAWRGGVRATFPVRVGRGALVRIVLDDGEPAPAGAEVKIDGDDKAFFVARRGEAFVTGLKPSNALVLEWNGQRCRMRIELPPGSVDELARVGPVACGGVAR